MMTLDFHNNRYFFPRQPKEKKVVKRALFPSFSLFLVVFFVWGGSSSNFFFLSRKKGGLSFHLLS